MSVALCAVYCSVCTVCATNTDTVNIRSLHLAVHWFTQGQGHHCRPIGESCWLILGR